MATLFMIDGFEHGRVTSGAAGVYDVVTGTWISVTTPVRSGLRAGRFNIAAAAVNVGYTTAANIITQSVYIRFATLPTADVQLMHFVSTVNCYLWFLNATDQFGVSVTTSGAVAGGPTLAIDTWYRVTVECDTSTNTFLIRAIVDGGAEFSDTAASTAANITRASLGNTTAATGEAFFDDWVVSVTDNDYEDLSTWTGHSIVSLIPSADGTHNITTSGDFDSFVGAAFSNATTTGWTFIDHRPLQVANTADAVIRQELGTTTNYMELLLEDLPAGTDTPIDLRAYGTHVESAAAGASAGSMRILSADGTVEYFTTGTVRMINGTEDPGTTVTIRKRMVERAGAWDRTTVDGLEIRLGFSDNAPDVNFIDCMLEVALQEAAVAAAAADVVRFEAVPFIPQGRSF